MKQLAHTKKHLQKSIGYIKVPRLWFFFLLLISLSSNSCTQTIQVEENYKVENDTDLEFLVCFEADFSKTKTIKSVLAHETELIYSNVRHVPQSSIVRPSYKLWIYNPKDSTYYKISQNETKDDNDQAETKNEFLKYTTTTHITAALVSQMVKDTQVTDSIFGLKQ